MDSEDVTLDWGANEDDEVLTSVPRKDAATLSGAESLLALASGPDQKANGNNKLKVIGEDKDSDVVSLGGDDDDMDELQAYQTRTNLGGMSAGEAKSAQATRQQSRQKLALAKASSNQRPPSPPRSVVSASVSPAPIANADIKNNGDTSTATLSDGHLANGKIWEESSPRRLRSTSFGDPARPPSLTSTLPPPGTHGLPPKPVALALNVPYVRPSHPSITSASTMAMAPQRDRDRDQRRGHASPKRGSSRHYSPDNDLPLAPDWEMRIARDGSNDPYYFNSKTGESTWDRRVATGHIPSSPPRPSYYPAGRRSPGYDDVRRGRSSRHESSSGRALSPNLSYDDRHYSPPKDDYYVSRSERGDSQRYQRSRSPEFLPSHSSLRRGNDRDISRYTQRARSYDDRSISDGAPSTRRDGERVIERPRSPPPGRDRYESNHRARGRDSVRTSLKETRSKERRPDSASGSYEDRGGNDRMGSSPHYRTAVLPSAGSHPSSSASQYKRAKSPQREDRYSVPSHETIRARDLSPQAASVHDRPPKRMRSSKSPVRPLDHGPSSSQSLPAEWGAQYQDSRARHYTGPPHMEPTLIPSAKYMEREENQRRELERSYDSKRRKTTDDLDSTSARRGLPDELDSRDARDNDHVSRRSLSQIDGPRTAPIGPRRRDGLPPRRGMDSYRPDPSSDIRLRDDLYPERSPRGPDRDRESSRLELPTRPRAMESDSDRRDSHYHRQSFDKPSTNDSIPEPRGSVQPPPADNRSRQHNRNRRDEGPRDSGEGRYAPSANNARYDTYRSNRPAPPPGLSGPNTIPLRPRFGDSYRPDEQSRRDRFSPQDARRTNNSVGESYRPSVDETYQASHYSPGHSPPPPPVADRSDKYTNRKEEGRPQRVSRFKDIEGPSSSLLLDQKHGARMDNPPTVVVEGPDVMAVDNIPRIDTSTPANAPPAAPMEVENNNATFPPTSGNSRRRSGKNAQRLEQFGGDANASVASPRPIHGLPPKPNVRPSSLLDRLSNPGTGTTITKSRQSPTLRDRVAQDAPSPKTSAPPPNTRPSLRDRLDSNPEVIERSSEDYHQRQGSNAPTSNSWRNNRSRKGRG